ncbi:MAG TPA: VWA domain-containing protein [Croceibacterium sp.]|nr:VWA domain-containing protein [Croceibacterium sp.]
MTHARSKAAVAMAAILLASCTGIRQHRAESAVALPSTNEPQGLPGDAPIVLADPRVPTAPPPPPPPPADESGAIVVTGMRSDNRGSYRPHRGQMTVFAPAQAAPIAANSPALERRIAPPRGYAGRDRFTSVEQNPFRVVGEEPVSTFSIDVDTASYGWMRASLNRNVLPQPDAVRTEEMINYFPYDYALPRSVEQPFSTRVDVFPSPWTDGRKLVRVGIRGYQVNDAVRPRANLVFLIDTSGSMSPPDKLGLVKQSLAMLLEQLDADDRVAIVTYAGSAGTTLEPTRAGEKGRILAAIEQLGAGGSTAGAEGIRQAYALAERNFDAEGVNRVILATDGDFNVGITDPEELKGYVERQRAKGVFLSVLGFGMGNYNDALMQVLAQNGNGNAAYIDTLNEARKTLVEEATSTLFPIARDVKIQVEFNPATVVEYRLVGYETRMLAREDFENDRVDAGDVGSGQTVTALYEIVPIGGPRANGDLRYARPVAPVVAGNSSEYGFVRIRYKQPRSERSQEISTPIDREAEARSFAEAPQDARFAAGVASFAELLRGGRYAGAMTYDDVLRIVSAARGDDAFGYRSEFIQLVRAARTASAMARLDP